METKNQQWGSSVLNILFTVFIIAIVFATILIASTVAGNTILGLQNQYAIASYSPFSSSASNSFNLAQNGNITATLTGNGGWISASQPLTIQITGNSILTQATMSTNAIPGNRQTQTFIITSSNSPVQLSSNTGNFYNISSVVLIGVPPAAFPQLQVTINQYYSRGS